MTTPINAANVILIEKLKIKIMDKYQKKEKKKIDKIPINKDDNIHK